MLLRSSRGVGRLPHFSRKNLEGYLARRPATPVHIPEEGEGGEENDEEQRRRAVSRENGQPAPGSAIEVSSWVCC